MGEFQADSLDSTRHFFARYLLDGRPPEGSTVVIVAPVPVAPLESFLRVVPRAMSFAWAPSLGPTFAGSGVARRFDLVGPGRLDALRAAADMLRRSVTVQTFPGCTPPAPRLFGGVSFTTGFTGAPWAEFGDGCFTFPRWVYVRVASNVAYLQLALTSADETGIAAQHLVMGELETILEALEASDSLSTIRIAPRPKVTVTGITQQSGAEWARYVDGIRSEIAAGKLEKVVAARSAHLTFDGAPDDIDVFSRLAAEPNCTRFCFRREQHTFLGATPETLFDKRGTALSTEALAGTIKSMGSDIPRVAGQATRLLASGKDLSEHFMVVREIRESLLPLSEEIVAHATPAIRKVRHILHLHTAITATLKPNVEAVDLIAAMHPTPAVAGAPTAPAVAWIVEQEPAARGWYAGPVGWLDTTGDGSFVVAIRAGVLGRGEAFVYTGAGIVADSNAADEYLETTLKQQPFLRALGIEETP